MLPNNQLLMPLNKSFNLFPLTSNYSTSENNNFKSKPEKEISEDIKIQIVKELIEPMYVNDVKSTIQGKKCWRLTGQIFETMSKILVAIGGIISFSSGYYNNPTLSFVAGSVSTVSLATLQFSSFSYGENKKQSSELNVLLEKLNIDTIPELNRQVDMSPSLKKEADSSIEEQKDEINMLKNIIDELHCEKEKEVDQLKSNILKLEEYVKVNNLEKIQTSENPETDKETNLETNPETNPEHMNLLV